MKTIKFCTEHVLILDVYVHKRILGKCLNTIYTIAENIVGLNMITRIPITLSSQKTCKILN